MGVAAKTVSYLHVFGFRGQKRQKTKLCESLIEKKKIVVNYVRRRYQPPVWCIHVPLVDLKPWNLSSGALIAEEKMVSMLCHPVTASGLPIIQPASANQKVTNNTPCEKPLKWLPYLANDQALSNRTKHWGIPSQPFKLSTGARSLITRDISLQSNESSYILWMLRSASDNRAFPMSTHGAIRPKACGKATMGGAAYSSARKACESWTLAAELRRRIQAMEMRCYRKLLRISYKDHVTNEEVRAKIQQAVGSNEDILTTVKRRKLQWCGHVPRSSGLAKTILQSTVKWGRSQGRQRKG